MAVINFEEKIPKKNLYERHFKNTYFLSILQIFLLIFISGDNNFIRRIGR